MLVVNSRRDIELSSEPLRSVIYCNSINFIRHSSYYTSSELYIYIYIYTIYTCGKRIFTYISLLSQY